MTFAGVNYLATIAGFAFGAAYYRQLSMASIARACSLSRAPSSAPSAFELGCLS